MPMKRRALSIALAAAAAGAALPALPASAPAATLERDGGGALVYAAAPGTQVNLLVSRTWDGAAISISGSESDPVADVPDGCTGGTYYGSHVVTCPEATAVRAELGDGDDVGQIAEGIGIPVAIDGGAGRDVLEGAEGADTLDGGPGEDRISGGLGDDALAGGEGADVLNGGGGRDHVLGGEGDDTLSPDSFEEPGADVVDGGPGIDTVTDDYASRFSEVDPPVAITLAGGADDGRPGEGDDLRGVERVVMVGVGGAFTGGDGADELRLMQVGSASTLAGLGGPDRLRGGDGPDRLDGGAGDDSLDGGFGDDVIVGGPGRDAISADLAGGDCGPLWCKHPYGNDRVEARDGEVDSIACGAGTDLVIADAADVVAPDCEQVQRDGAAPGPGKPRIAIAGPRTLRVIAKRGLLVKLTGLRPRTTTTVRALAGRRLLAAARVRADAKGRATARLRFTGSARRALARQRPGAKLTLRAGAVTTTVTLKQ